MAYSIKFELDYILLRYSINLLIHLSVTPTGIFHKRSLGTYCWHVRYLFVTRTWHLKWVVVSVNFDFEFTWVKLLLSTFR